MSQLRLKLEENHEKIENSIIAEISDELLETIYEMSEEIFETGRCDSDAYASKLESTCQVFVDQMVERLK